MPQKSAGTAGIFVTETNVKPLDKMTTAELQQMFERQSKLLKNKSFLDKLPDKGKRIKESQAKIETLLKQREQAEQLSNLMSGLSLRATGRLPDVNKMEWNLGSSSERDKPLLTDDLDTAEPRGEDEESVLRLLTSTNNPVKSTRIEKHNVIEPSEIAALGEDKFSHDLVEKTEHQSEHTNHKERFLPNRSLRHDHLTPDLEKSLTNGGSQVRTAGHRPPHWNEDFSAAHEPPTRYDRVKPLPLEKSLELQLEQAEQLRRIELKRAEQKLAEKFNIRLELPEHLPGEMGYRERADDVDDILGGLRDQVNKEIEEEEVFDDDDVKDVGGITYTYSEIQ